MATTIENCELVMWNPSDGDRPTVTVESVRQALAANGLRPERAKDIPHTTAFRRAVAKRERAATKEQPAVKATVWGKSGVTYAQLDELLPSGDRMDRGYVQTFSIDKEGHVSGLEVSPHDIEYTNPDVAAVLMAVIKEDGMGAYSPKANGHAYFVPTSGAGFLDRLQRAMAACGMDLLRFIVPDTEEQRNAIRKAVASGIDAEIEMHRAAIGAYNAETAKGVISNRREALASTKSLINKLIDHLAGARLEMILAVQELENACDKLVTTIETSRPITGRCLSFAPATNQRSLING